jgi:hypothetical protein
VLELGQASGNGILIIYGLDGDEAAVSPDLSQSAEKDSVVAAEYLQKEKVQRSGFEARFHAALEDGR